MQDASQHPMIREYLTVADLAESTGLSVAFWRKAVRLRRIGVVKLGRAVRVRRCDFDAYIAQRVRPIGQQVAGDR